MHLVQDMLEIVGRLLDRMGVHPFISGDHNAFISRQALHLLLHIASLVGTSVVASAKHKNHGRKCSVHHLPHVRA